MIPGEPGNRTKHYQSVLNELTVKASSLVGQVRSVLRKQYWYMREGVGVYGGSSGGVIVFCPGQGVGFLPHF